MDKKEIKRENLKNNFLKQAIIRLDYDMLFEKDMERFIESIYPDLIKEKYKMNKNTLSNINVNFNLDINDTNNINNISNEYSANTEEYTAFQNSEGNVFISIEKEALIMTNIYSKFEQFEELSKIFNTMIENLKDIREGFSFNRIGIRKTNVLAIKNISKINNYLEESTFCFTQKLNDNKKTDFIIKDSMESFIVDSYKVNKGTNVAKGTMTDENKEESNVYQIILDIDIYNDQIIENNIKLEQMNNRLFEVYKDCLKIEFLNNMQKDNYIDEEILKI